MATLTSLDRNTVAACLKDRSLILVDIRETDEYAREHIDGAVSLPLPKLESAHVKLEAGKDVVFQCRTANRTGANCARLSAFAGAGLTFAGVSGWCGMAKRLAAMPWNRRAAA